MMTLYEKKILTEYFEAKGFFGEDLANKLAEAEKVIDGGYPLGYYVGHQAFFELDFYVNEDVLIPRPDTERLVETALALLPQGATFLDLGTGSGCIAISLLYRRSDLSGIALDISENALAIAKKNADMAKVSDRLTLLQGDMTAPPALPSVSYVISNPPYIPKADIADYPSLCHEPQEALDGGEDGMDFYRSILAKYREIAEKGFLLEIGFDQKEAITALAASWGYACLVKKDYGGNDRVAILTPNRSEYNKKPGDDYENSST